MPDLPTLTLTDEQMGYVLEAFKNYYSTTTTEETVKKYKQYLAQMVIDVVKGYQVGLVTKDHAAQVAARSAQVDAFFPDPKNIT